jgi:hypothetical protein
VVVHGIDLWRRLVDVLVVQGKRREAAGALRDDTMTSFKFSHNYYLEATFGQFRDWMWKVRAGYTNNGSATGANFSAEQIGLTVVRRF